METVRGYIYTHYNCPYCDEPTELEGDTRGETIECPECEKEFEGD